MIELICEKPLTSITVKDVCARADINRSTFYLHYKDVDSLLVAVEDYAIEYIQSHFKGLGNAFDELVGFLTYMKNTPRLRNLFFALAGERGDPRFTRRLQELTFQNFERRWLGIGTDLLHIKRHPRSIFKGLRWRADAKCFYPAIKAVYI